MWLYTAVAVVPLPSAAENATVAGQHLCGRQQAAPGEGSRLMLQSEGCTVSH